jgi:hydroxypyruvate isomerase
MCVIRASCCRPDARRSIVPKFAANLTMLFGEIPFLDRFAAAKAAGFGGVEYLFPYDFEKAALREQLQQHGLTQVLHNLPAGNWAVGERGIAILPDRVDEFRDGLARAIDYAKALDCHQLNCLVGIAPRDADVFELNDVLVDNLRFAAGALAKERIRLLIEPINTLDIPGFFLNRTEQAVQILSEVQSDNLFIQYDIYHMQVMEGDVARTLERHLPRIAHVQLADNPGRNEPGTGEINYPFLFRHLDAIGYRGWVGCEYKPRTTTVDGLGWHAALTLVT